eukprot:357031-Chlamydomonas_euryale.AAC.7
MTSRNRLMSWKPGCGCKRIPSTPNFKLRTAPHRATHKPLFPHTSTPKASAAETVAAAPGPALQCGNANRPPLFPRSVQPLQMPARQPASGCGVGSMRPSELGHKVPSLLS